jgi:hypothetical protein
VADWGLLRGEEYTLIGGYESGIDAAIHLAWKSKRVNLVSRGEPWHSQSPDPSRALSPYTRDRLKAALMDAPGSIHFFKNADIKEVVRTKSGYFLIDEAGDPHESATAPVLCTGFKSPLRSVANLFEEAYGAVQFTEEGDESTITPGLFYSGPALTHRQSLFCFIYKFRSRFGIVARTIASRLNLAWETALEPWKEHGFMMEDLACCTDCKCAVEAMPEEEPPVEDYRNISHRKAAAHA